MKQRYFTRASRRPISNVQFVPDGDQITLRRYAAAIGLFLSAGYLAAAAGALLVGHLPGWPLVVVGIMVAWAGLEITARLQSWAGSLAGHVIASAGTGLFLGPVFFWSALPWLRTAALVVLFGTLVLTLIASFAPGLVRAFGSFLIALPLASVFVWSGRSFWSDLVGAPPVGILSTITALLFLAYTDRYWTRALALPRTLDNAADSACAIYADTVNSILRFVERVTVYRRSGHLR